MLWKIEYVKYLLRKKSNQIIIITILNNHHNSSNIQLKRESMTEYSKLCNQILLVDTRPCDMFNFYLWVGVLRRTTLRGGVFACFFVRLLENNWAHFDGALQNVLNSTCEIGRLAESVKWFRSYDQNSGK